MINYLSWTWRFRRLKCRLTRHQYEKISVFWKYQQYLKMVSCKSCGATVWGPVGWSIKDFEEKFRG